MIRHPKDFFAGLVFLGFGAGAIVIARGYPMGNAMRMGPGYFPAWKGTGHLWEANSLIRRRAISDSPQKDGRKEPGGSLREELPGTSWRL